MNHISRFLATFGSLWAIEAAQYYGYNDASNNVAQYVNGDDGIKYWTDYAVLPKKCITYNNVDMIVFSVFPKGYKQCTDSPSGTYMTSVPTFVGAYLNQLEANAQDQGEDYEIPESADFLNCYAYENENGLVSI